MPYYACMQLSAKAIKDLRIELHKCYEANADIAKDEYVNEIGSFLLISLAEVLKHKVRTQQ